MDINNSDEMLEPHKAYHSKYKDEFRKNAEDLFDELTKKSKVNYSANRDTIKKIRKLDRDIEESEKKKHSLVVRRRLLIILSIMLIAATIIVYLSKMKNYMIISLAILLPITLFVTILTIVLHAKFFRKKIKELLDLLTGLSFRRNKLIQQAKEQMAPLNVLFDWNIPAHLVEKTIPMINMDQYYDARKAEYLRLKYGFGPKDKNTSTVFVQSGSIFGNPFLLCRDYQMHMYNKTYYGSITISWTTIERTDDGYRTVYHSETLTASVSAPAPGYYSDSYLVYGNDAAPKLIFSRGPSGVTGKSEKEINKIVKKESKKLVKKGEKSLLNGGSYQTFGNEEFEVLFGGTDRNNELEYRLLFTPLAQKNLLDIIRHGKPYGDDFRFYKKNCLNYIKTSHGYYFNYSADPRIYMSYDYDYTKNKFIEYNCNYFESFYFELAPLMSIPLYQQHKSLEYLYEEEIDANFAEFEYERMANTFDQSEFKHPQSCTDNILKTKRIETIGDSDKIVVTAHSFRGEPRTTYVSVYGGDGHYHDVPVNWTEYFPVEKDSEMLVSRVEATRYQYSAKERTKEFIEKLSNVSKNNSRHFEHCILATILKESCNNDSIKEFNEVLKKDTTSVQTVDEMLKSLDDELKRNMGNNNFHYDEDNRLTDDSTDELDDDSTDGIDLDL